MGQMVEIAYTANMPEHLGGEDADVMLEIAGTYVPPCRGSRDEYGVPLEPDEYATFEIETIRATSEACYGPVETVDASQWYDSLDMRGQEELIGLIMEEINGDRW